jgi:L-tartrate/succinate antiporter
VMLAILVCFAVLLWIFAAESIDAAIVAFIVISLMLILGVVTWDDMARNHSAWTTLVLLATLVAMADGLGRVGFVSWLANYIAGHITGFSPTAVLVILISAYFFSHYLFSSLTAHTTTMMPIMLAVGMGMPNFPGEKLAIGLVLTTGLMGIITPYATGAALPYYNSGYISSALFWRNGTIYGLIFLAALLLGMQLV